LPFIVNLDAASLTNKFLIPNLGLGGAQPVVHFVANKRLFESLMLCGIGLLGGCLLTLLFILSGLRR
jgi:hypothetical protein